MKINVIHKVNFYLGNVILHNKNLTKKQGFFPKQWQSRHNCKISYLFCVDGDCLIATWASSDKAFNGELGLMRIP